MYNYSKAFYDELEKDNRDFLIKMSMVVKDLGGNSVSLNVSNEKIFQGTFKVDSATSGVGQFEVGSLVASSLNFSLYNENEEYSAYDFVDGTISLQVGMVIDGVEEVVNYGRYIISNAKFSDNEISIEALDTLSKVSQAYVGGIMFPCSLNDIIRSCTYACGVDFDASSVPNWANSYIVEEKDLANETYANIVSYCAQIIGCYVRADHEGRLALNWYDLTETGHAIDGLASADIATDDVVITGVKVVSSPANDEEEIIATSGTDEYVISVSDNPFVSNDKTQIVADRLFDVMGGMTFRPLDISILSNPAIEAGDVATVTDYKGKAYRCFFSNVSFCPDTYSRVSCDAMSVNRQASASASVTSQVLKRTKAFIANEKTAREIAIDTLASLTANSLGFFSTDVTQEGGGTIRYMHNKPKLEDSATQWKITEEGFVVSTDYGKTWNAGIDKSGNAVVNVLSAVGINADWINAGHINCDRLNGGTIHGQHIDGCTITSEGDNGETVIQGGQIISNNAKITGGEIRIVSTEESWDYIQLLGDGVGATMSDDTFTVFTYKGTWDDFKGYGYQTYIEPTRIIASDVFLYEGESGSIYPPRDMRSIRDMFYVMPEESVGDKTTPVWLEVKTDSTGKVISNDFIECDTPKMKVGYSSALIDINTEEKEGETIPSLEMNKDTLVPNVEGIKIATDDNQLGEIHAEHFYRNGVEIGEGGGDGTAKTIRDTDLEHVGSIVMEGPALIPHSEDSPIGIMLGSISKQYKGVYAEHFYLNGKEISGGGGSGGVINTPLGTIISYMGNTPPEEYLACDGAIYNISKYRELADFINREFGSYNYFGGDGTSTFAVPDLRGEFLRGTGTNSHQKQGNGAAVGVHKDATEIPVFGAKDDAIMWINSNATDSIAFVQKGDSYFQGSGYTSKGKYVNKQGTWADRSDTSTHFTTKPTNTSVLYCIKYKTTETGEVYSLEEKVIGKWIDGKPVYRKVITHTTTEKIESTSNYLITHNTPNIKSLITVSGSTDSYGFPLGTSGTNDGLICLGTVTNTTIQIRVSGIQVMSRGTNINIILEYTKTTD